MAGVKKHLAGQDLLSEYHDHIKKAWNNQSCW
jgi:hypothetical protein